MQRAARSLRRPVIQEPPIVETTRLLLRAHEASDLDALAAMWADPDVIRHLGGARTRQDSWFRLLRYRGLWPLMGYGYWAVRERSTNRFVGDVGFGTFERDITPSIIGQPEAGWAFTSDTYGRGYATEALTACLLWLDRATEHRHAVCLINDENRASLRVAEKTGFVRDGSATDVTGAPGRSIRLVRDRAET